MLKFTKTFKVKANKGRLTNDDPESVLNALEIAWDSISKVLHELEVEKQEEFKQAFNVLDHHHNMQLGDLLFGRLIDYKK